MHTDACPKLPISAFLVRRVASLGVLALATISVALFLASSASAQPTHSVVFSPTVDGTVVDSNFDGSGDWVHDGLGSAVVGDSHPALGTGEDRGVFEFDLGSIRLGCVFDAQLLLNVAGSFGSFDYTSPNFTLYAGPGDAMLAPTDFSAMKVAELTIYSDPAVDVTEIVRLAILESLRQHEAASIRFVLAWDGSGDDSEPAGLLFGTNELEQAYGHEYRSAELVVQGPLGACVHGQ